MTAAYLLMTSAWMAGADPVPPAASPAPAPMPVPVHAVPAAGPGCGACPAPAPACDDSCGGKPGLLDKLRAKFAGMRSKGGCDCTPCGTPLFSKPVFAGFTTAASDCGDSCGKPSLLDKLRAKFKRGDSCGCPSAGCETSGCTTSYAAPLAGCALPAPPPAAVPSAAPPAQPPQTMPKPEAAPAPVEKKSSLRPVPPAITPVSGGKTYPLGGSANPF